MNIKVSKDLLSKVLFDGKYKLKIDETVDAGTIILIRDEEEIEINEFINIYELAHKCKEWAVLQGYNVTSKVTIRGGRSCKTQSIATARLTTDTSVFKVYGANTEPQSIFKACQWIMDNQK